MADSLSLRVRLCLTRGPKTILMICSDLDLPCGWDSGRPVREELYRLESAGVVKEIGDAMTDNWTSWKTSIFELATPDDRLQLLHSKRCERERLFEERKWILTKREQVVTEMDKVDEEIEELETALEAERPLRRSKRLKTSIAESTQE